MRGNGGHFFKATLEPSPLELHRTRCSACPAMRLAWSSLVQGSSPCPRHGLLQCRVGDVAT